MKKGIGIGCLVLLLCFIGMYFVMNNEKLISKNTYLLSYFESLVLHETFIVSQH